MELLQSRILGKGHPLIILHGFLGMSDNWKTLGNQFAQNGFQVHLIDQRNHGRSFHSPNFDYRLMGQDLLNYLDYHEIAKGSVIGHSMGGKTAMQFATSQPKRMDKLIVADISPKYYPPHYNVILDALEKLDFESISSRKEADEVLSHDLPDLGTRQFLLKNLYWTRPGKLGLRFNLEVLKTKTGEIGTKIDPGSVFSGPTLFLRGARSTYILPNDHAEIKKHFPKAEIETIENAGHWLHVDNPGQFFGKSSHFLKAQDQQNR